MEEIELHRVSYAGFEVTGGVGDRIIFCGDKMFHRRYMEVKVYNDVLGMDKERVYDYEVMLLRSSVRSVTCGWNDIKEIYTVCIDGGGDSFVTLDFVDRESAHRIKALVYEWMGVDKK